MNNKFISAVQAAEMVRDGDTIASVGVIGWITPDSLLKALGVRYEQTQNPKNCTFYFPCGTGDAMGIKGMDHIAREGLMKRIVSGSYINPKDPITGERPKLMTLIKENRIEAYSWPIGASMHWLREVAKRSPGFMTEVGIDTYIDPNLKGGKVTEKATEDLVERFQFRGIDVLFYPTWDLNVAFIRATSSDDDGNLSFEKEAIQSSALALAIAVKACGGTVIAQVERRVHRGQVPASQMLIPAALVDHVVVDPEQMMVTEVPFDERYLSCGDAVLKFNPLPGGSTNIFARRAALEVRKHELTIYGFGASSTVQLALAEAGKLDGDGIRHYPSTTEHGSYGGVVMGGWQFSANQYPEALIDGVTQFDVIAAGQCKLAVLSFAEFDDQGVVNVSRFAGANPGAGGFIDIAHHAQRIVLTGTFTTAGLKVAFENGKLQILQEGKVKKFVSKCEDVTYRVMNGVQRGQETLIVTERAVFKVHHDAIELIEVAPGIDVNTQVLGQMDMDNVNVSPTLKIMSNTYFKGI